MAWRRAERGLIFVACHLSREIDVTEWHKVKVTGVKRVPWLHCAFLVYCSAWWISCHVVCWSLKLHLSLFALHSLLSPAHSLTHEALCSSRCPPVDSLSTLATLVSWSSSSRSSPPWSSSSAWPRRPGSKINLRHPEIPAPHLVFFFVSYALAPYASRQLPWRRRGAWGSAIADVGKE